MTHSENGGEEAPKQPAAEEGGEEGEGQTIEQRPPHEQVCSCQCVCMCVGWVCVCFDCVYKIGARVYAVCVNVSVNQVTEVTFTQ